MVTILVGELMTEKLETIDSSSTAQQASKKMEDNKIGSLVVVDKKNNGNKPIGIITERDLVRKICVSDANSNEILVKDIMSSPLVTIDSTSSVEVAADMMAQNKVRHLLVVEESNTENNKDDYKTTKPLGIITPSDFVGYLKENLKIDTQQLRQQGASLKKRMEKIIQSFVEQQQQQQQQQGQSPAPSREGVMYG